MGARERGGSGQIIDGDRLGVTGVGQVFGAQQTTGRRNLRHGFKYGGGPLAFGIGLTIGNVRQL
ncbi:MAG TPA: hypothetical protein VN255_09380 [Mycobacterium sp.]|nr:hypothetical protein [Mycobacterium sp.]